MLRVWNKASPFSNSHNRCTLSICQQFNRFCATPSDFDLEFSLSGMAASFVVVLLKWLVVETLL